MVEEVVKTDVVATDTSDVTEESSASQDVIEESSTSEVPGASELPSGKSGKHEETVSYERFKEVNDKVKSLEERLTEMDSVNDDDIVNPPETPPLQGAEDPIMAELLAPFPKSQWDELRDSYQPIVNRLKTQEQNANRLTQVMDYTLREQFFTRNPDLKKGTKDANTVIGLITRGYDETHAKRLVKEDPVKMKEQLKAEIATENNKLNQIKKDSNTVGGASGTPAGGTPSIPLRIEGSEEYFDKMAYRGK